jgi:hypothetical protein
MPGGRRLPAQHVAQRSDRTGGGCLPCRVGLRARRRGVGRLGGAADRGRRLVLVRRSTRGHPHGCAHADVHGMGRPRWGHHGELVRPRHARARDGGPGRAAQPGRPCQPVDRGAARWPARRVLLAARRPGDALPGLLTAGGRDLVGGATDRPGEHAGYPRLHVSEPRSARGRGPDLPVLARRQLQPDLLGPGRRLEHVVPGAQPDSDARGAPLCEVRLERWGHHPRGLHERAPGRVRRRQHGG